MKAKVSNQRAKQHQLFLDSLGDAVVEHSDINQRPLEIKLSKPFDLNLRVYLFTCSNPPGGRSPSEYKFNLNVPGQIERGDFDYSDNALIILSAVVEDEDPNMTVFVLWDAYMHKNFAMNANVQTKADLIQSARLQDVATLAKKNGELVLGARRKNLLKAIKMRNDLTMKKLLGD